jgi:regulator of extracellular matrix RemA (YlzA/DUF370 family)
MKFINIGYGNIVAADRIILIAGPDSSPVKRLIQDARENGMVLDVSCGRKTRAVIVSDSGHVILSALKSETLAAKLGAEPETDEQE